METRQRPSVDENGERPAQGMRAPALRGLFERAPSARARVAEAAPRMLTIIDEYNDMRASPSQGETRARRRCPICLNFEFLPNGLPGALRRRGRVFFSPAPKGMAHLDVRKDMHAAPGQGGARARR